VFVFSLEYIDVIKIYRQFPQNVLYLETIFVGLIGTVRILTLCWLIDIYKM